MNWLKNSWAGSFGFSYDALNRRTQLTRPKGVNTNYGYDSVSHLLSVLHQVGNTTLEVLGAVNVHIMQNTRRVEPPLSMEEICSTVQEYYKQCLIQNLQTSQYAPDRLLGLSLLVGFKPSGVTPLFLANTRLD